MIHVAIVKDHQSHVDDRQDLIEISPPPPHSKEAELVWLFWSTFIFFYFPFSYPNLILLKPILFFLFQSESGIAMPDVDEQRVVIHDTGAARIDVPRDVVERYLKQYIPEHMIEGWDDAPEPDRIIWTPARLRFKAKTMGLLTVAVIFACFIAFTILLAVNDSYNLSYFTLWNFTLHDLYYFVLCLSLIFEHWILTYTVLLLVPLANGTSFFVAYAIVIIVGVDASVYLQDTIFGVPPGKITIEQLHTGDWVEHAFPPFADLLSNFVLAVFYYRIFNRLVDRMSDAWQWIYFFFFIFSSFAFLGIYQLYAWIAGMDLQEKYLIPFSVWVSVLLALGLNVGYMLFLWFVMRAKQDPKQVHVYLFPTHRQRMHREEAAGLLSGPQDELEV